MSAHEPVERFDLVILGSGATAFGVALRASELGATVAMVEERTIGGTCVNRGCLPSSFSTREPSRSVGAG